MFQKTLLSGRRGGKDGACADGKRSGLPLLSNWLSVSNGGGCSCRHRHPVATPGSVSAGPPPALPTALPLRLGSRAFRLWAWPGDIGLQHRQACLSGTSSHWTRAQQQLLPPASGGAGVQAKRPQSCWAPALLAARRSNPLSRLPLGSPYIPAHCCPRQCSGTPARAALLPSVAFCPGTARCAAPASSPCGRFAHRPPDPPPRRT